MREFTPSKRKHEWDSPPSSLRKRIFLSCFCLLLLEFSRGLYANASGIDTLIAQGAPPSSTVSNKKIEAKQIPVNPITVKPIEAKAIPAKQIPVNPITVKPVEAKPIPTKQIPVNPIQVAPIQPKPLSIKPIELKMAQEDLRITDDVELAIDQAQAYPNSPEAQFLLAVSYSRTPYLERALKSIQKTKKLIKTS
ncbi:MAG: hypothetical protein K2X66_13390, partial [Cyanobacteria bacterium]|nr:hypothetical protein [Cyanobacteriota bacterium]